MNPGGILKFQAQGGTGPRQAYLALPVDGVYHRTHKTGQEHMARRHLGHEDSSDHRELLRAWLLFHNLSPFY